MRVLGEILVNVQSDHVFVGFEIYDRSCPTLILFCDLQRKFPVRRFVSDGVLGFDRWNQAITNQNDR